MNRLLVTWKDPVSSLWKPVAILEKDQTGYKLRYTSKAKALKNFTPFGRMYDLDKEYKSQDLFPLFSNRLLPPSRPEYKRLISWLDLDDGDDPMSVLAITHGERATDSLKLFSCPELEDGQYRVKFFAHGLSHLDPTVIEFVSKLKPKTPLFLMEDYQNEASKAALTIRTGEPKMMVGYCPDFLASDLRYLSNFDKESNFCVRKINQDAPPNYMLLCEFIATPPKNFKPFEDHLN